MAETASLVNAHNHVRKATKDLQRSNWSDAAESHRQASDEFSKTARSTSDNEALRVLRLLETEHRRLATIIASHNSRNDVDQPGHPKATLTADSASAESPVPPTSKPDETSKRPSSGQTQAVKNMSSKGRESSPSLARDIASRRGIPPSGGSPSAKAKSRQVSPESLRRKQIGSSAMIPASVVDSQATLLAPERTRSEDDEGFTKFYSSLTTGTMSRLSSVLAYAGLPLTSESTPVEHETTRISSKRTVSASNEPDVKKYFSKAALNAIDDEHRQKGSYGRGFGPAESFYVVPTSGGTSSYADIARPHQQLHQQQQPHLSDIGEDDEEAFVDAREKAGSMSPQDSRSLPPNARSSFGKPRTQEELELENTTLKNTLEQLAARLTNFETHAQDASMAALTQSMATLRPPPPPHSLHSGGPSDAALQERLRLLEEKIQAQADEKVKLESVASRQEKMLKRYHSKWEEVKKSAKEKERLRRETGMKMEAGAGSSEPADGGD